MKLFFICRSHKQVFYAGDAERDGISVLQHHRASSQEILFAITQFAYSHLDCDAGWITENALFNMDLTGFRRIDSELGIPFKGPSFMTVDESNEALGKGTIAKNKGGCSGPPTLDNQGEGGSNPQEWR